MKLGKLDTFITIGAYAEGTTDGFGHPTPGAWTKLADAWAERVQSAGREFLAADAIEATQRVVFRTHWIPGVTTEHRVRIGSVEHNIHEVRPLGRNLYMELHTTAVAP